MAGAAGRGCEVGLYGDRNSMPIIGPSRQVLIGIAPARAADCFKGWTIFERVFHHELCADLDVELFAREFKRDAPGDFGVVPDDAGDGLALRIVPGARHGAVNDPVSDFLMKSTLGNGLVKKIEMKEQMLFVTGPVQRLVQHGIKRDKRVSPVGFGADAFNVLGKLVLQRVFGVIVGVDVADGDAGVGDECDAVDILRVVLIEKTIDNARDGNPGEFAHGVARLG